MTSLTENILNIPRYLTVNNLIEHQIEGARCFVGVRETESNLGPEVEIFQASTKAKGVAWCASFVIYIINDGICFVS